jgi:hypothetical protein
MMILGWCSFACSIIACILALGACMGCRRMAALYEAQMQLCAAAQATSSLRAAHAHTEDGDGI